MNNYFELLDYFEGKNGYDFDEIVDEYFHDTCKNLGIFMKGTENTPLADEMGMTWGDQEFPIVLEVFMEAYTRILMDGICNCIRSFANENENHDIGAERIAAERKRQIEEEGFTAENDRYYDLEQLAGAAACYALPVNIRDRVLPDGRTLQEHLWPFENRWWRPTPKNRIRELEKAGALIAAEIDRLLIFSNEGYKDD